MQLQVPWPFLSEPGPRGRVMTMRAGGCHAALGRDGPGAAGLRSPSCLLLPFSFGTESEDQLLLSTPVPAQALRLGPSCSMLTTHGVPISMRASLESTF